MKLQILILLIFGALGCGNVSDLCQSDGFGQRTEAPPFLLPTPTPDTLRLIDFNVRGVRLGDTEASVIEKLGKPIGSKFATVDNCGVTKIKTLKYKGLEVQLDRDLDDAWFVLELIVTSDKVAIDPNVRIGEDLRSIREKFGDPNVEHTDSNESDLYFITRDNDNAHFMFNKSRLIKVRMYVNPC